MPTHANLKFRIPALMDPVPSREATTMARTADLEQSNSRIREFAITGLWFLVAVPIAFALAFLLP